MIQVDRLTKYFGDRPATRDLSFRIEPGSVVGFLGLNGAGKTTTLRMLAGDLAPSAGTVRIHGRDIAAEPRAVKRQIGFLPEVSPLYPEMTVREYLGYAGGLRGLRGRELRERVPEAAETVGLETVMGQLAGQLSHGYRQRLGIAQATIHRPELVILDEPFAGLDPAQIAEMRALIRRLAGTHTVLLSSHLLSEIRQTCDRLLVMGSGRILADGPEEELQHRLSTEVAIEVIARGDLTSMQSLLAGLEGVRSVAVQGEESGAHRLRVGCEADVREAIARLLVESGVGLLGLHRSEDELEVLFLELTRDGSSTNV
jgi:ABC-2 type transport system ATP-binding protein